MTSTPHKLPLLIRTMLDREFYPHETAGAVELIQTHISYVLLTGTYAYKVKKPVDYGFVDFSTLDRRQYFCAEELRLNLRGAPGLYLEVLPVTAQGGGYRLRGTGTPVEYAVKMRQFAPGALMSDRLERGEVTDAHVIALARTVASYHARAAVGPSISRFGEPARIRQAIDDNYRHTERFVGGPLTREQFEQIRAFTDGFFDKGAAVLTDRVEGGSIRECHGDLHLANICFWEGSILLFDCIEFNESFRYVDVMYDVAFTAMDLEARGRADLATLFVNEYAERTGDWNGLQMLPLYRCHQAYVRAKVNSLLLEDPEISQETRSAAARMAAAYYRLASRYAQPGQERLMLMSGLSGSGKSTIARELARRTGAVHIRSDAVRKHLAGVPLEERAGAEVYGKAMTERTYERLLELGILLASQGLSVILDARYDRRAVRLAAIERARSASLGIRILHCEAPDNLLRGRMDSRHGDLSDATSELLEYQRAGTESFTDAERPYVRTLDSSQPVDLLIDTAWEFP